MDDYDVKVSDSENIDDLILTDEEAQRLFDIEKRFLGSYAKKEDSQTDEQWLKVRLKEELPDKNNQEIQDMADEIVTAIKKDEECRRDLDSAIEKGIDRESWLAEKLVEHTSAMTTQESALYLHSLDNTVRVANDEMAKTIYARSTGNISGCMNLDGFIAEQKHVNSFNLKAAAGKSEFRAKVLRPEPGQTYGAHSVDVGIYKVENGKTVGGPVERYQLKYGQTAEETIALLDKTVLNGQTPVVPTEQLEAVRQKYPTATDHIGKAKIKSDPLTKADVKNAQNEIQSGNVSFLEADWSDFVAKDISIGIAGEVGKSCLGGIAIGAGMKILDQVVKGDPVDGGEVIENAIETGADFGVKTAVAGGLKVAAEKELISVIPKGTPAGVLANVAFVAVEDVKVLGKIATGELSVSEGIDELQRTTVSCTAGLLTSAEGAGWGWAIGTVFFGPVGGVVGGLVGGAVGYAAGSKFGETVVNVYHKVRDAAKSVVKTAVEGVKSFFSGVVSLFGF